MEQMKDNINATFVVDDLFHLQRGGRVSKTTAMIGSALNLKPVLYINADGGITSDGTIRGRKKSFKMLIERMISALPDDVDYSLPVGIVHSLCLEDANTLAEMIKQETKFTNIIINDISPSIGTHTGPLALGLMHYGVKKKAAK